MFALADQSDVMKHPLLIEIERYLAWREGIGHPVSPCYFSKISANNARLIERLRAGGDVTTKTADRVRKFIKAEQDRIAEAIGEAAT